MDELHVLSRLVHRFESGRERHLINELREYDEAKLLLRALFGQFFMVRLLRSRVGGQMTVGGLRASRAQ